MLLQRPGLVRRAMLPGPVEALFRTDGGAKGLYAVSNAALYSIFTASTGVSTTTKIGDIAASAGQARIASNFDRLMILAGGALYLYGATASSTVNSFRAISLPDTFTPVDVTTVNGYFIVACADGTFYWLVPGADAFDALNFATAESDPDGLIGVSTLNGNLLFFGSNTVEVWQPSGNADLPFQRLTGQDYQRGCIARDTIAHLDNALFWVGEDGKVYRGGAVPMRISTDSIDERIRLRAGQLSAWTFAYDGHLFYVLRIANTGTFAYDVATKTWSEFRSTGFLGWRPWLGCSTPTGTLCGDSETGAIYALTDASTDDDVPMRRAASATVAIGGKPARVDNITLDVGSEAACTWRLRWADGGEILADQPWTELAARPGSDTLTLYRLGQALAPFRYFEIEVTDPVGVRLSGAHVGEAWR